MLAKRIIPCLDIKNGRAVKGVNFVDLRDAGNPIELAKQYAKVGADELVFLDISATLERRKTICEMVLKVAEQVNIPFTVGGGISSIEDVDALLKCGADKISINSSAVKKSRLINELSQKFGSQCIVVAIDAKQIDGKWLVHLAGGTIPTELNLFEWAKEVEQRGAGEILFTSMNHDGTKAGFANEALAKLSEFVNIPIIASGGAGSVDHFIDVFTKGKSNGALAASVFHFGEISIPELKRELRNNNIEVRYRSTIMNIDFNKNRDGLIPAIIQDSTTKNVLMLGYMNQEAFDKTQKTGKVTFFSRTKNRLWTKGEESGNFLNLVNLKLDCDNDTLLIQVNPIGSTCHKGSDTCWNESNDESYGFISKLENTIANRIESSDASKSYVASLFEKGINKVAQKFGEEAVEVVIEAKDNNDDLFLNESADLLFHYLMLLQAKGFKLNDVVTILKGREK